MQILITNLTTGDLSLDLKFAENQQLRTKLGLGESVDVSDIASYDEVIRNPAIVSLRANGKISVSADPISAVKVPCLVATTANITLSGAQTIDDIAVVAGNRVLVKDQTA